MVSSSDAPQNSTDYLADYFHLPCRKVVVKNETDGTTFTDEANIVVGARGTLNDYKWPEIPGLKDFKGTLMHSAAWDSRSVLQFVSSAL